MIRGLIGGVKGERGGGAAGREGVDRHCFAACAGRVIALTLREREPDGEAAEHRRKPEGVKGAAVPRVTSDQWPVIRDP